MSRADRFDRADFQSRYEPQPTKDAAVPAAGSAGGTPSASTPIPFWPVAARRIGQSVLTDRNGKGRPHKGVDLFVPGGSPVRAVRSGKVLRVIDGRNSADASKARAGLFIDIRSNDGLIYRYLHLGSASVTANETIRAGTHIGTVAPEGTSGTGSSSHLHLEVRKGDWNGDTYGDPIDPLTILKKK